MCIRVLVPTLATIAGLGVFGTPVAAQVGSREVGAAKNPPAGSRPVSGGELLHSSIRLLESRTSISARIRQQVRLFGRELVGTGTYLEQRSTTALRFRLESKIRLGAETSTLLEVCDGQYLWRYLRLQDEGKLTRIEIDRVLRALEESGQLGRVQTVDQWPGLGGLAKLLRGLHSHFDFASAEQSQLMSSSPDAGESSVRLPVWRIQGGWKREILAELIPQHKEAILAGQGMDLSELQPPVPQAVVVYLAADDLFPHRIEYYRSEPTQAGKGRGAEQPIVVVELIQLNVNVAIDPNRFFYNPGNLDCVDRTTEFLKQLGLEG